MFSQIMQIAAANGSQNLNNLEQISINSGNLQTSGYKARRFETYLRPDGMVTGAVRVDTSQGQLELTSNEMDIAIDGGAYIPVTQPDGKVAYTRDGSLAKNNQGFLVTRNGDLVGNGIQLPMDYEKLFIRPDGTMQVQYKGKTDLETIGKLNLVTFQNPEGLKNAGFNKLVETPGSGPPQLASEKENKIRQGNLERANVNMYSQVDDILRINAGYISNLRIIKVTDSLYQQSVNLRQ